MQGNSVGEKAIEKDFAYRITGRNTSHHCGAGTAEYDG
jgi:hypothetical protein